MGDSGRLSRNADTHGASLRGDVNYIRMAENYNDPCHVHYIHEFAKWLPKGVTIIDHERDAQYLQAWHAAWDAQGNYGDHAGLRREYHVADYEPPLQNYTHFDTDAWNAREAVCSIYR